MNNDIEQRWKDYCNQITETARRFTSSPSNPDDEVTAALKRFKDSTPPRTDAELGIRIGEGDQLKADWELAASAAENSDGKKAYTASEYHEPIPMPTQSIAEQAELAKKDNQE